MRRANVLAAATVVASIALVLSACTPSYPHRTPNDPGIPEARADAEKQIAALRSELHFSDQVVVLGTGHKDDCGAEHNWWFDNDDPGYRCWMSSTTIVVVPSAQTPQELAAAMDAELVALNAPYVAGSTIRNLISLYPSSRDHFEAGGYVGTVRFFIAATPFSSDAWPDHMSSRSNTSAADVQATGANHTVEIEMSVEYWTSSGVPEVDAPGTPEPVSVVWWSYGSTYAIEVADWAPVDAPTTCTTDPSVDQKTISHTDVPFRYLRFDLVASAGSEDQQRIRDCVVASVTSGTVVVTDPYE